MADAPPQYLQMERTNLLVGAYQRLVASPVKAVQHQRADMCVCLLKGFTKAEARPGTNSAGPSTERQPEMARPPQAERYD